MSTTQRSCLLKGYMGYGVSQVAISTGHDNMMVSLKRPLSHFAHQALTAVLRRAKLCFLMKVCFRKACLVKGYLMSFCPVNVQLRVYLPSERYDFRCLFRCLRTSSPLHPYKDTQKQNGSSYRCHYDPSDKSSRMTGVTNGGDGDGGGRSRWTCL